ncbi:hypothetical protein GPECTOR_37g151 [Gonium pectorale]|uniref:Uncharacterized protein n=1 Tax=Gonium pectorale TaxID=33097 RepID=A0A150GBC4_GONPE|nr:hypothetical protein GPECTOR_37g151 [Gonium pectorale]|eukprot:KXZ47146.1 hypothetical protein GPECTOR_37g151 [Gonium pectorale]
MVHQACKLRRSDYLYQLLANKKLVAEWLKADGNRAGFAEPFLHAATEGYSEILVALIQAINVVDDKQKSILARHLQTRGGEGIAHRKTPLQIALEKRHLETVTVLVQAAQRVEGNWEPAITALGLAAKLGKWKMARQIVGAIKAKRSPGEAADEMREALKLAANHGKRNVVRVLLSKDANKDLPDDWDCDNTETSRFIRI